MRISTTPLICVACKTIHFDFEFEVILLQGLGYLTEYTIRGIERNGGTFQIARSYHHPRLRCPGYFGLDVNSPARQFCEYQHKNTETNDVKNCTHHEGPGIFKYMLPCKPNAYQMKYVRDPGKPKRDYLRKAIKFASTRMECTPPEFPVTPPKDLAYPGLCMFCHSVLAHDYLYHSLSDKRLEDGVAWCPYCDFTPLRLPYEMGARMMKYFSDDENLY